MFDTPRHDASAEPTRIVRAGRDALGRPDSSARTTIGQRVQRPWWPATPRLPIVCDWFAYLETTVTVTSKVFGGVPTRAALSDRRHARRLPPNPHPATAAAG